MTFHVEILMWESCKTAVVSPALQYMCTKKDVADAVFTAGRAFGPQRRGESKQPGNKGHEISWQWVMAGFRN